MCDRTGLITAAAPLACPVGLSVLHTAFVVAVLGNEREIAAGICCIICITYEVDQNVWNQ